MRVNGLLLDLHFFASHIIFFVGVGGGIQVKN